MENHDLGKSGGKQPIRVFVVDDHPIVREGLEYLLNREEGIVVCGSAESANEAMATINDANPDLAVVDIGLKEGVSGLELVKRIHDEYPLIKTFVLSMLDENIYAERAIRAGARGYLMKEEVKGKIVTAIRQIMSGKIYLSDNMVSKVLDNLLYDQSKTIKTGIEKLTNRELEVLQLIGEGYKTHEIAEKLNVSVKTVGTHRFRVQNKLNLKNSTYLVKYAIEYIRSSGN